LQHRLTPCSRIRDDCASMREHNCNVSAGQSGWMESPHSIDRDEGANVANYGFNATLTAGSGMGDRLIDLLLTGLDEGSRGASGRCVVYLVSRSASDPDVVHVTEGWTSEEGHHQAFAGEAARAIVAQIGGLLAEEAEYTDLVTVRSKAAI
jgi:quinol monooxygenase YgiN